MVLNLFEKNLDLTNDKLHPKFILLRDQESFSQHRKILLEWTEGFVDRDNKILKEFQTTFHSSLWEFFLFAFFKEAGFELDQTNDRPDFMITSPQKINIEAVTSNIKKTGRPEADRNLEDILSSLTPPHLQDNFENFLNESIIRHSNAIKSKHKKYIEGYSTCKWVKPDVPFVIALGSYDQINYGREFYYPLMALMYGLYFNNKQNLYEKKDYITKSDTGSKIPIGLFLDPKYKDISAVVFSCTITMGKLTALAISKSDVSTQTVLNIRHDFEAPHYKLQRVSKEIPEHLSDGVFIFHNPNANKKLSLDAFSKTNAVQITYEKDQLNFKGSNLPIVARLDVPKILFSSGLNVLVDEALIKYNKIHY